MGFEIPREEVENMSPEDFVGTFTRGSYNTGVWIQRNEMVDEEGDLRGLCVWEDGEVEEESWWAYHTRRKNKTHYRTLEDLVQGCDDEVLLKLFLKEL